MKIPKEKSSCVTYFQPPGIKSQYCEVGMISETDKDYIWYLDEPCKILISEVKIIPQENVVYNYKKKVYVIKIIDQKLKEQKGISIK